MSEGSDRIAELEARLRTLADRVRRELPERAAALRDALGRLDVDEEAARSAIKRMAHMVRGSAGSHGMTELTEPAACVEVGAHSLARAELGEVVRALADRIEQSAREGSSAAPAPAAPVASAGAGVVKPLAGRRVLAIDDDAPTRRLLTMTLANLGGASTLVEEAPEAFFAALAAAPFDVVIVDAMMPGLNGLACLERVAASSLARPGTRYYVLSAATPEELGWVMPASLDVAWLRKPFRPRDLLDAIRAALG